MNVDNTENEQRDDFENDELSNQSMKKNSYEPEAEDKPQHTQHILPNHSFKNEQSYGIKDLTQFHQNEMSEREAVSRPPKKAQFHSQNENEHYQSKENYEHSYKPSERNPKMAINVQVRKTSLKINQNQSNPIYQSQNTHELNDRQKSLSLEYGKTIKLLRNGDAFYRGHKVVINSRKYRYLDVFLNDVSDTFNAGAIRKIHTPVGGQKIESLDELEDGKIYVAAGNEAFVKMNYAEISEGKRQPPNRLPALNRSDYNNLPNVPQYEGSHSILISIFRNGDFQTAPHKILLYKNSMISFEAVLNEISNKVQLLNGPVLKLYSMQGQTIFSPAQLTNGHAYVAASREKFKSVDYNLVPDFSKSRNNSKDLPPVKIHAKTKVNFNNEDVFKLQKTAHSKNKEFNKFDDTYAASNQTFENSESLISKDEKSDNLE